MEKRKLGNIEVSVVGLGCNNFGVLDVAQSRRVVDKAIECGITLFDTADVYGNRGGSESQLGEILGPRRKNIVLATKYGMPMDSSGSKSGGSRAYVTEAVEASLKRLNTDWIDLYQMHRPDTKTPVEETLRALDDLVKAGKVRQIGCSNFSAAQIDEAQAVSAKSGLARFVTAQDEYSLVNRTIEKELTPAIERHKMTLLPYFPLASGLLSGKYKKGQEIPNNTRFGRMKPLGDRYMTDDNWRVVGELSQFCEARDHSLLELAFSWLVAHPFLTSVIAGATRPEQIEQNVKAASWKLSKDELAEVDRITGK